MAISYEEPGEKFAVIEKTSKHAQPHIHRHFECILLTAGTLELGVGQEYYHMEKGDFAIVFPDLIHHYQVFEKGRRRGIYLLADPNYAGSELSLYTQKCPANPVISAQRLHPDIVYAMRQLLREKDERGRRDVRRAFFQLIMARALPEYEMIDKSEIGSSDMVYRFVEYMAAHFTENITLPDVAHALGLSKFTASRLISQTFHTNFNQYLNRLRVDLACEMLLHTDYTITDICFACGFESQRTFNRVFRDFVRMTPREYGKLCAQTESDEAEGNTL